MRIIVDKIRLLIKSGLLSIIVSGIIEKVLGFISNIIVLRIISKYEYGLYTYAWNIFSIIMLLSGIGTDSAILQLLSEKSGNIQFAKRILKYGGKIGVLFNIFLSSVLVLISLFAPLKIQESRMILFFASFLPCLQYIFCVLSSTFRSQKNYKEYSIMQVLFSTVYFVSSVLSVIIINQYGLVLGNYIGFFVAIIYGCHRLRRLFCVNTNDVFDKEIVDVRHFFEISLITMVNNGLSQLLYLIDIFLIGILDPKEVVLANYKVATIVPFSLGFLSQSIVIFVYPFFAQHNKDGKWCLNKYLKVVLLLGGMNIIISLLLFVLAPYIIYILYGKQYLDAVPVFRILTFGCFFSGTFRTLSGNLLVAQNKIKYNLFTSILAGILNIVLDFYLISRLGSYGAAFATVSVIIFTGVLSTTYLILSYKKICITYK